MMLDQELGSIMAFCKLRYPEADLVTLRVPVDMPKHAVYFPPPVTQSTPFAGGVFMHSHTLLIKVFAPDSPQAYQSAAKIVQDIYSDRGTIPRYNIDGTLSGRKMKISSANIKEVAECVILLTLTFESKHPFLGFEYEKMGQIKFEFEEV